MTEFENNAYFWQKVDTLFLSSNLIISRHKGDTHPIFRNMIYPVEYGRLDDTLGTGTEGLSVYVGSDTPGKVTAVVIAADILMKTIDIKLLTACTEKEVYEVLRFLNQTDFQKTVLIRRGNHIPVWGLSDHG